MRRSSRRSASNRPWTCPGVGRNFHNHVLTGVIHESPQPVPPGKQNLSESAMFVKSDPAETGPDLQIAFVHVPFNIIVGQGHPNSISILPGVVRPQVTRLGQARQRGSGGAAARRPELPRRPERPREAGRGGQDRAPPLRHQGVRAVGRCRADAGRRPEDRRRAARLRQGHRRLVPPPGGLVQDGHRRPRGRRPGAQGPRRGRPAGRRRQRHAGRAVGQLPRRDPDDRGAARRTGSRPARPHRPQPSGSKS